MYVYIYIYIYINRYFPIILKKKVTIKKKKSKKTMGYEYIGRKKSKYKHDLASLANKGRI